MQVPRLVVGTFATDVYLDAFVECSLCTDKDAHGSPHKDMQLLALQRKRAKRKENHYVFIQFQICDWIKLKKGLDVPSYWYVQTKKFCVSFWFPNTSYSLR